MHGRSCHECDVLAARSLCIVQYDPVEAAVRFAGRKCNERVSRRYVFGGVANLDSRTASVGTNIDYKGNDYLAVDLSTRLIYNATSSSDLLNFYSQLGDDVIAAGL